jgi:hypothetical protein
MLQDPGERALEHRIVRIEVNLAEVVAISAVVIDQIELIEREVPLSSRIRCWSGRNCGHHELDGLSELNWSVQMSEGAQYEPGRPDPSAGNEDFVGVQALPTTTGQMGDVDPRGRVDLAQLNGEEIVPIVDPTA